MALGAGDTGGDLLEGFFGLVGSLVGALEKEGAPLGALEKEGAPLGALEKVGAPLGALEKEGAPLGTSSDSPSPPISSVALTVCTLANASWLSVICN